ncbi:MAG TPA: glycosyltransferase family 87 protein [Xanthobacteraceae bacterium]|nr:glycosyltransferase family 87 protein [Xanthobacteraceae bacterium]
MTGVVTDPVKEQQAEARALALLSLFFFVLVAGAYFYTANWGAQALPRDGTGLVVGRDFLNFWMYGRAALTADPSRFYDAVAYNQELTALLGANYPGQNWSYPPSIMLPALPFGQLGYMPALLIWTLLGAALFFAVARRHLRDPRLLLALLLSPAAVLCIISGQSSLITAAILIGIFSCLDRKPIVAGILIALLTLKPQLGLLFPFMLLASGRWRVFIVATVASLAIAAVTAGLFGPQVWADFVLKGLPVNNIVLSDPNGIATPFYPTVFMNLRGAGASYALAMAVQLCFAAVAVATVVWAFRFRRDADPRVLMALFFACSISFVPYLLAYDTLALTLAALMLLESGKLDAAGRRFVQIVFWLPILQMVLGTWHIPGPALVAPAFALYLVLQLRAAAPAGARVAESRA